MNSPDVLDILAQSGGLWIGWAFVLVLAIYVASLASALTSAKKFEEKHWISVGPFFAWFVGVLATFLMLWQLQDVAALLSRLAQFSGAADLLVKAHATAFVALVIVVTARAYFVISEMDAGRYAGGHDLPTAISKSKHIRWWEAWARLLIIAGLTLFAGAFVQVVIPYSAADMPVAGAPFVLYDIRQDCAELHALLATIDHGYSETECVRDRVADLTPSEVVRLANSLIKPMPFLLGACYILMLAWCILVWRGALGACERPGQIRSALLLQCFIAAFALINLLIMLSWVHISTTGDVPFISGPSRDVVAGSLITHSVFGFLVSATAFCILSLRLWTDLKSMRTNLMAAASNIKWPKRLWRFQP